MRYCKRCLMPDTRPHLIFNDDGVCQACKNYDKRKTVDWQQRYELLESICDRYRRKDGYYDCIIAVSGGKDSYFLTHIMKNKLNMNPLLICVNDPFTKTKAGVKNLKNLNEIFGCDLVQFSPSTDLFRRVTRLAFEKLGEPLRFIESVIYTIPQKFAVSLNIPLIIYGENAAFEYGTTKDDHYSASLYVSTGHSAAAEQLGPTIESFWINNGFSRKELNAIIPPSKESFENVKPNPIFLSYFIPWDDEKNYEIAKKYGFSDLRGEWDRDGCIEYYSQIDSVAYLVHIWLKYPKFGFARVTDIVSRWIRRDKISREEGIKLVMMNDHKLDPRALDDFVTCLGYSHQEFWKIVEKFWNKEIFENVDNLWVLKNPLWKLENKCSNITLPKNINVKETSGV